MCSGPEAPPAGARGQMSISSGCAATANCFCDHNMASSSLPYVLLHCTLLFQAYMSCEQWAASSTLSSKSTSFATRCHYDVVDDVMPRDRLTSVAATLISVVAAACCTVMTSPIQPNTSTSLSSTSTSTTTSGGLVSRPSPSLMLVLLDQIQPSLTHRWSLPGEC